MRRIDQPAVIRSQNVSSVQELRAMYRAELYLKGNWILAPVWGASMSQCWIACQKLFPDCKFRVVPVR